MRQLDGTLDVTVTVTGQNEGPAITETGDNTAFTVSENHEAVLFIYAASDPEGEAISHWSTSGRDGGDFAISESGELTFRNPPDFERPADSNRDNVYEMTVRASDGRYYGTLDVTVTVQAVDESPEFRSGSQDSFVYRENGISDIYTYRATDPEGSDVAWGWSGTDSSAFTMSELGVLSFVSPPDYESPTDSGRDNVYELVVKASDEQKNTTRLEVSVTVTNLTDARASIQGTAQVGRTLTADTSGIPGRGSRDGPAFSYQWMADDKDIKGATKSTYKVADQDEGKALKVKVTFTDGEGNEETVTSPPTHPVAAKSNSPATGAPTISGTPQVSETLTANTSGIADADGLTNVSWSYQWIAGGSNINGATGSTHTLTASEQGKTIQVRVTFTDDRGNAETLTSKATDAVAPPPNQPAAGAPSIQGVLQDQQVITADTVGIIDADGLGNATFSYQWMRVTGGDSSEITGQTSTTYTLTTNDVGSSVRLKVAFTDDREHAESVASAVTGAVIASGATRELLWLSTMIPEDPDGLDTDFRFSSSADEANLSPAAFTDGEDTRTVTFLGISFSNETTLALELASPPATRQVATWRLALHETELAFSDTTMTQTSAVPPSYRFQWDVTALAVDDTDPWDDGEAFTVSLLEAVNLPGTGAPTISGTPQDGETLTASTAAIADGNGLDDVSYQYQWSASGSDIGGATGSSLTLHSDQEGDTVQVKVTFTDDDGFSETLTSVATVAVAAAQATANNPPTGLPTISGTTQVEQTLTADTSGISDQDGLTNVSYSYQWLAGGYNIDGATGYRLTLTASQQGKTIQVQVTFTDDAENEETLTSAATDAVAAKANTAPTGLPTISGTAQVGQTLTADTAPIDDADGLTNVSYRYQWIAGGSDIDGATGSSLTLVFADQGKTIKVKVSFTDDADYAETLTSEATEAVAAAPNRDATGLPTISGTPQVEQTLTAYTSAIDDADGLGNVSYEYQWLAGGSDISGATGSSYLLTSSEQGQTIQVRVTFTDDADNQETLTSEATMAVAAKPNTAPTGLPTISGTPQVEQTLTVDTSSITDQDGLTNVSYSYQWIAGGSDIAGATSSRYTLTGSEQGQTIQVRVNFTDERDNAETLTSLATTAVAAAPNRDATGQPTIGGTPQVGETLTADTSAIADEDGLGSAVYSYQWLADDADIAGATVAAYTLVDADEGAAIKVRVSFTDDAGHEETLTSVATVSVAAAESAEPPAPPTGLTAAVSHEQVVLSWDDPQDDSITGYVILRRYRATTAPGEFTELVADTGSAANTYTDDSVAAETSYTYRIKAINGHGVSELSRWVRADTPAAP